MGGAVGAPARTRTLGAAPSITNSAQPGCAQAAPRTHCVYTGARALLLLIWERVSECERETRWFRRREPLAVCPQQCMIACCATEAWVT